MTTASLRIADRYELVAPVGRGGSATVWRARDSVLDRDIAVKQVRLPDSLPDRDRERLHQRVLREARAAARLEHRNVVTVHDVIEEDGDVFIIMAFVGAPTLADIIDVRGPLDEDETALLGTAILDALEAAHGHDIVHRDVKPSNIIVVGDGDVRLTDFGIAAVPDDPALTRSGVILGSPGYISPEQVRGEEVGVATDLWGLGATLYHAVEGVPPFQGDDDVATIEAVAGSHPRPVERADALASLLRDLLQQDPSARPSTAQARERLATVHGAGASEAGPTPAQEDEEEAAATPSPIYSFDAIDDADVAPAADDAPTITDDGTAGDDEGVGTPVEPAGTDEAELEGSRSGDGDEVEYRFDDTAAGEQPVDVAEGTQPIGGTERWDAGSSGDASGNPRRLLVGALVLVAVIAIAALLVTLPGPVDEQRSDEDGATSPQPTAGTAQAEDDATSPSSPQAAGEDASTPATEPASQPASEAAGGEVPDDWVVSGGDTYRVAHPPGWQAEQISGVTTQYRDPETRTYIRVTSEGEQQDPVAEWEAYADQFAAEHDGYEEIRIEPYEVDGRQGAIWEYRYEAGGASLHAVNIKIPADGRGYAFNLQSHEGNWDEASAQLETFLAGFEPTPAG